jgi:phosphohistidine phosphatase
MNLYFLRHAIAIAHDDPRVQSDGERFLTAKGIKRMRKAAQGLRMLKIPFDAILTSPAVRARQTADIVAGELKLESNLKELIDLGPESTVDHLILGLSRLPDYEHLLLVGHEPLLTQTVAFLLTAGKERGLNLTLKKAGLCQVEIDRVPPSKPGTLHFWLTPKQLRLLGKSAPSKNPS